MATQDEVNQIQAAVTELQTSIGEIADAQVDFAADFDAAVKKLQEQIGGNTSVAPILAGLADLVTKAKASAASIKELDTKAEEISGQSTPPVV